MKLALTLVITAAAIVVFKEIANATDDMMETGEAGMAKMAIGGMATGAMVMTGDMGATGDTEMVDVAFQKSATLKIEEVNTLRPEDVAQLKLLHFEP